VRTCVCGSFLLVALRTGMSNNPELFDPATFGKEWGMSALFQPLGAAFGYIAARLSGLEPADARAVCLETGVQSYPVVLAIIGLSYSGCDRVQMSVFPLIATFWYIPTPNAGHGNPTHCSVHSSR
jgi:predicted Na+-dependent transporter